MPICGVIFDLKASESSLVLSANVVLILQELEKKVATLERELGQCRQHGYHDLAKEDLERPLRAAEAVNLQQHAGRTPSHPPDCIGERAGPGPPGEHNTGTEGLQR